MADVIVIGAGVVGAAVARELTLRGLSVCVVERGYDVACATSRANSGIVHAGFDAANGSKKAHYNVAGSRMYPALAAELGFTVRINGSLVCAFTDEERENLQALYENGLANGVTDLEIISTEKLLELEPNANPAAICALWAPGGGITNPYEATLAFATDAAKRGAEFRFGTEVTGLQCTAEGCAVTVCDAETGAESTLQARVVVNAAGVYADQVAALAGSTVPAITARRGEYVILDKREGGAFGHTMFRAPSAVGKGVLVSPTADGNIIVGPNAHAVDLGACQGDAETTLDGITEVQTKAKDLWPELPARQTITRFAGLRATPANHDFTIEWAADAPGLYNVTGIESPGLTAAPAIAVDVASDIAAHLLGANPVPAAEYPAPVHGAVYESRRRAFARMTADERAAAAAEDPAWGRLVCRCEEVTEAEIREALRGPLPALSIDAIKWRTRAGMGRCHGGFCSPHVADLIAQETGCALCDVRKREANSQIAPHDGCVKNGPLGAATSSAPAAEVPTSVDVLVVGGGAAGIASALSACEKGVPAQRILLLDREDNLGGILKQCIHPGFGLERYRKELTGPEYAARDITDLAASGIPYLSNTTVTRFAAAASGGYTVEAIGPDGALALTAKSVVLATGSRERSAGQLVLDGTRPAGVYTAGCAQHFMNLKGTLVGRRVVVWGSGDIGLIMARRLAWEGAEVLACVVRGTKPSGLARNVKQCLVDNHIPILLSHTVTRVLGHGRVTGVEIVETDRETKAPLYGTETVIDCDTLLLSCGLIPEQDLLVEAGGAPTARGSVDTSLPGVFLAGNASAIHDIVDNVTEDSEKVGALAAAYVLGTPDESGEAEETAAPAKAVKPLSEKAQARLAKVQAAREAVAALAGSEETTCICCPKGCTIYAAPVAEGASNEAGYTVSEGFAIGGNECNRGLGYAVEEMTTPRRTITSVVRCADRLEPLSVRTDGTVLRSEIPQCLAALKDITVSGPVHVGDLILADVCGTGVNFVSTKEKMTRGQAPCHLF